MLVGLQVPVKDDVTHSTLVVSSGVHSRGAQQRTACEKSVS